MTDKKTPPIEPLDYLAGVKVVDIGDLRVARGLSRRPFSSCPHRRLHYDSAERRIWCADCETDIEAFDAFTILVGQYSIAVDRLKRREEALTSAENHSIRSIAAKAIDKAWQSHKSVPACPHCGNGLFPEDFKNGVGIIGREYAAVRIRKAKENRDQ